MTGRGVVRKGRNDKRQGGQEVPNIQERRVQQRDKKPYDRNDVTTSTEKENVQCSQVLGQRRFCRLGRTSCGRSASKSFVGAPIYIQSIRPHVMPKNSNISPTKFSVEDREHIIDSEASLHLFFRAC